MTDVESTFDPDGSARGKPIPRAGEQFGNYQVEGEIARGGAGVVLRAVGPDGVRYALKIFLSDMRVGARQARFEREVMIGTSLRNPGIVRVVDHGEIAGRHFLVMELLENALTLDRYVRERQVSLADRVQLLMEAAQTVHTAHKAGIVHRDLKPDNVLVTPEGQVKVLDFGIAKQTNAKRLTQSGTVMGTLHYMAPEQASGEAAHADTRTDVYALGVIAYELMTGELPFDGDTAMEILSQIVSADVPNVAHLVPSAPKGIAEVIAMATARDPAQRYADAGHLAKDLAAVCTDTETEASTRVTLSARNRLKPALAVGLTALAGAIALGLASRGPDLQALRVEAGELRTAARAQLQAPRLLAVDRAAIGELAQRANALLERVKEGPDRDGLAQVVGPVRALEGLLALAEGERDVAESLRVEAGRSPGDVAESLRVEAGRSPGDVALRGALLATDGDPHRGARLLARALRQGVARHDLLGWQAEGWVEGGLSDVRHAAEALDALKALEAARDGRLLPSERVLRARAHLARGEPEQAAVAMTGIDDPLDPALRWRIALATAAAALSEGELERTADALADMPADHDPAGRADLKATVVRRVGTSLVAAAASDAAGEEAEPRLTGLVKIAALLDPESPLPRELLSRLLEITTRMQQSSGLIDLGTTLAEAFPNDARVQLEVGSLIWRRKGDVVWNRRLLPALRRGGALATDKGDRHMVYFRLFGVLDTLQQSAPLSGAEREEALGAAAIALDGETSDGARAQIYRRRAKFRFRIGDPDGAMRDSDAAIALNSRNPDSVVVRLDLLAKVSGYDDAYAASLLRLSELVEKTEDDMDALTRAWSMYRTSPGSAAPRAVYEQLLAAKPNGRPRAWVRLGLMRRANGEHSLAKEAFAAALERLAGVERRAHFARTLATLLEMLETGTDEVTNQINRVAALVWSSGT